MSAPIQATIQEQLGGEDVDVSASHGMTVLELPPARLLATVRRLKEELGFDLFLDVTAVDWPRREPRFDVVYHFYSTAHRVRVRVRTRVTEAEPAVDTLTGLYGGAREGLTG